MAEDHVDVVVVSAGLAGLRCAGVLAAAGRDVQVWEQHDDVGGRVRTDVIDGFLCDRGFQVLNPAYPELRHAVDIAELGADGRPWKLLTRSTIRHALPAQPVPLRVRRSVEVGDRLWWCGDHRDTASIQGALVSGRRTAERILAGRR